MIDEENEKYSSHTSGTIFIFDCTRNRTRLVSAARTLAAEHIAAIRGKRAILRRSHIDIHTHTNTHLRQTITFATVIRVSTRRTYGA